MNRLSFVRRTAGIALLLAGLLVATLPRDETRTIENLDGEPATVISISCVSPITAVFGRGDTDAEWFGYAPNTGVAYVPGDRQCRSDARRRVAIGAVLGAAGVLLLARRRRIAVPTDQGPPDDHSQ